MEPAEAGLRGGEFAGVAFRTLQWVFRAIIWCKKEALAMRNPPGPKAECGDALGGGCCAGGGPTGRGSPACGVLATRGCRCPRDLAQRKK